MILTALAFLWLLFKFLFDWEKDELVRTKKTMNTGNTASMGMSGPAVGSVDGVRRSSNVARSNTRPTATRQKPSYSNTTSGVSSTTAGVASTSASSVSSSSASTRPSTKTAKPQSSTKTSVAKDKHDNLTKIEGIGPKINELLNDAGIYTYNKLASTSAADLKEILVNAGSRFQMHEPDTWPQQASYAERGDWSGLETLQQSLNAGKK